MRIAIFGLMAATAVLCSACSPAVGSPEWCKQQGDTPKDFSTLTPEVAKGLQQCAMNRVNGIQ